MTPIKAALGGAMALVLMAGMAQAKVVLSAASSFPEGHLFSTPFENFVKDFNAANGDEIVIDYKGGAPAIGSPFTLAERVQRGQFDMMAITGPYYETTVPVALSLILTDKPIAALRRTDWIAAMEEAHEARGLRYLGKITEGGTFHLYLRTPIETADLTGLRLRVAPHYQPFFSALGATTMRSDLGEIYTLMENGSIDGFGWPLVGFLPDWLDITAYRVEPGFYDTDFNIVMNLEAWTALSDDHKRRLADLVAVYEAKAAATVEGWTAEALPRMDAAGMKVIRLSEADAAAFLKTARDTGWASVLSRDPELGARLRAGADAAAE